MASLEVRTGPAAGKVADLDFKELLVGRDSFCDLVIADHTISRQHTRVIRTSDGFYVEDMGSLNGTLVNGQRIQKRTKVADQDQLTLHETLIIFHENYRGPAELPDDAAAHTASNRIESVDGHSATIVDALQATTGAGVDVNAAEKLRAVLEITHSLGSALIVDDVLPKILDVLFKVFPQADRGYITFAESPDGSLSLRDTKHRKPGAHDTLGPTSAAMAKQVVARGQGILSADAFSDDEINVSESVLDYPIRSMMCAPLMGPSRKCLGAIYLDTDDPDRRFFQDDLEVLLSVAAVAGQAIDYARQHESIVLLDRRERELATAHEVQLLFLPRQQPQIPGYGFFSHYESAEGVGGDYYGHMALPDARLAISVGDVSGKGVSAALMMARLSAEVRYFLATVGDCGAAITQLNHDLTLLSNNSHFITFCLCVLDPATHQLTIVNAGHMAPLRCRRTTGEVEKLGVAAVGMPLGVREDRIYQPFTTSLKPGDVVVMYTDGISEAMNPLGKTYGSQRLQSVLVKGPAKAVGLGKQVMEDVAEFTEESPQSDDICLVCFSRD